MVLVGTIAARRLRPSPQEEGKETTTRERRRVTSVCRLHRNGFARGAHGRWQGFSLFFFLVRFFPNDPNTRPTLRVPAFQGFLLVPFVSSDGPNTPPIFPRKQHKRKLKNAKLERRGERSKGAVGDGWAMGGSTLRPRRRRRRRRRHRRSPHTVPSLTVFNLSFFSLPSPSRLHDQRPLQPHEKRREISSPGVLLHSRCWRRDPSHAQRLSGL